MDNVIKHYFHLRACGFRPCVAWACAMGAASDEEFWVAED